MIYVEREPLDPTVKLMLDRASTALLTEAEDLLDRGASPRELKFNANIWRRLKPGLLRNFSGKCAFSETRLDDTGAGDVEHFRPKAGTIEADGSSLPFHYCWLAYDWDNLFPISRACNMSKGARFPIGGRRAGFGARGDELLAEQPLILNPCRDDPDLDLRFDEDGRVTSTTRRGQVTIDVFRLNDPPLVHSRAERAMVIRMKVERMVADIKALRKSPADALGEHIVPMLEPGQEFLGLTRQMLRRWIKGLNADLLRQMTSGPPLLQGPFGKPINPADPGKATRGGAGKRRATRPVAREATYSLESGLRDGSEREGYFGKSQYIRRVEIRDFRGIESLDLDVNPVGEGRAPWLVLLGENSVGKSSVLQAIALAVVEPGHIQRLQRDRRLRDDARAWLRRDVRRGEDDGPATPVSASVKVYYSGSDDPDRLVITPESSEFSTGSAGLRVFLAGYGATRNLPREGHPPAEGDRAVRVANLFDPFAPLSDAEEWLTSLPDPQRYRISFEEARDALRDLLRAEAFDIEQIPGGDPPLLATLHGVPVALADLSDGFRSMIALAVDIMKAVSRDWDNLALAEGIVLLDEIGPHLHPTWKMRVVDDLRRCFPRLQFIATTHDPLCLRGVRDGEVVVLRRDRDGRIVPRTDLPPIEGMRADQILTSEHFGLNTTLDPALELALAEYYDLLASRRRSADQEARLAELKAELEGLKLLGDSRREQIMLEAADLYVARRKEATDPERRRRLHAAAREGIASMWEVLNLDGEEDPR